MASQITKRYATAYFKVAREKKALEEVYNDLKILKTVASKFKKILIEVNSPISTKARRFSFVKKLTGTYTFHLLTKNFLSLLARNKGFNLLEEIIKQWLVFYLNFKNEVLLEVISVKKIKDSDLNYIKKNFEKEFGKKVQLKNSLDTSILGGIIIKMGSSVIDNSIATKLRSIGFVLKEEAQ